MKNVKKAIAFAVVAILAGSSQADAALVNGGFEAGLGGWSTLGITSAIGAHLAPFSPLGGATSAFLSTSNGATGATDIAIEAALGLAVGSLDALGTSGATEGSVIYQSFAASAGNVIDFKYVFITDEEPGGVDDVAFVSILVDGLLTAIASVDGTTLADPSVVAHGTGGAIWGDPATDYSSPGLHDSGLLSFTHTLAAGGIVTLAIGVFDGGDTVVESGLVVDDITVTPEPSSLALLAVGSLAACGCRRFRRRQSA